MALTSGTKLGPYEITGTLGAGGMGEVYRARDTRLERTVAIKILPAHLSSNPESRQRFEREARAISSLNHPNICTLHDVGHQDGIDYLVMEFLEGETLADRLRRGPLSTEQVLKYGIEICEGLEKAHRSGVVHRDLKPGNIMLTKTGAKLMDFGLAKAMPAATGPSSGLTATIASPPESPPLTARGMVVGTFQYMSPEQVEGKEADARSDIFAFGAVLYEMATGKRAFQGNSQMSVMAAILEKEPEPISVVNPLTPPLLDHIVRRSLAKNPEERWQSAQDLKLELEWARQSGSQASTSAVASSKRRSSTVAIIAAALALAAILLALGYFLFPPNTVPAMWANLNLAGELIDEEGNFALSPDGQKVAYVAATPAGNLVLWVRHLRSLKAQPLEGAEGAEYPSWSHDSQSIAFFADGKLKRVDATGERLSSICDAINGRGGAWNRDGMIVFAPNVFGGLARVSAAGGTPVEITHTATVTRSHRWPFFLPDGRHFLFVSSDTPYPTEGNGIFAGSVDTDQFKLVSKDIASNVAYLESGYLLYVSEGKLMAQQFDLKTFQLNGEATDLAEGVRYVSDRRIADFSAASGSLIFLPPNTSGRQMVWFNREGRQLAVALADIGHPSSGTLWTPVLSPDGSHAVVERARGSASDIWIFDLKTGTGTRLTFTDGFSYSPMWSRDGSYVAYHSSRPDAPGQYIKPVSGGGAERLLQAYSGEMQPSSFSPDGRYLALNNFDKKSQVMVLPLQGGGKAFPFPPSAGATANATFSPDGKWIAFDSDESGRSEVYVVPFPGRGGKWQISASGGHNTWWVGHGEKSELLYLDSQARLTSVPVHTDGNNLTVGTAQVLLGGRSLANTGFIDITRDGQRILLSQPQPNANTALTLVLNWNVGLKK